MEVEAVEGALKPTVIGKKYERLYENDLIYKRINGLNPGDKL